MTRGDVEALRAMALREGETLDMDDDIISVGGVQVCALPDGGWIVARWDAHAGQWWSRDVHGRGRSQGFVCAYAPTLARLTRVGVRVYPDAVRAMRAALGY